MDTEAIYQALFDKVRTLYSFPVAQRRLRVVDVLPHADTPALFQVQDDMELYPIQERSMLGAKRPVKCQLHVNLLIYATASPTTFAVQELNPVLDAILSAFGHGEAETLGGLVLDCKIGGKVRFSENTKSSMVAAIIPIEILAISK